MDLTNALYTLSCCIRPKDLHKNNSKTNPYIACIDGHNYDIVDIRMMGIAYQTIADHLDKLNKELK